MSERDEAIDRALHFLQRAILKHPLAAQALYAGLVREGRAYAETSDGAELRARLARSELVARAQTTFELVTLGLLDHDPKPGALPSVLVDVFIQAFMRERFEARTREAVTADAMRRP